ncbi:MAG: TetR/AcrR family transcriptional regulator [Actinobacteria bacterium]|nr:TetR/AcrR family transcriptional regulator [Actinomycetota bacterium]
MIGEPAIHPDADRRREHRDRREQERSARHLARSTRHADRREELLDAAVAGIRKHGPSASMDQLAAEAGITKPILYRHFGDRAGLARAVADRFANELEAELGSAITQETDDARSVLAGTIEAFVGYIERDPALYRFLVQPGTDATVDLSGFLDRISNNVAFAIGEQLRASGRDSGGAEVIARGVVFFVYAAGDWWVDRRTMPRTQLVSYVTDFLSTGFNGQWGSDS